MLCNACGHLLSSHVNGSGKACGILNCGCRHFVLPGDADAYESTRELVQGAIDETRELVKALPAELFVLRRQVAAAELMAEKCRPFLSDLELRAAYDAFRAFQAEQPS